jgi:uncharacterized 2Fe-2S/4Fe-4S cluster protein (DUF4445 family)
VDGLAETRIYSGQDTDTRIQRAEEGRSYGIGIDIGTTTVAAALVSADGKKEPLAVCSLVNRQRRYGADVISRISASAEHGAVMRELVEEDIAQLAAELLGRTGCRPSQVTEVVIAGNTTMLHLLRGYDCTGLGVYPYHPLSLEAETLCAEDFGRISGVLPKETRVTLFPGFTAFVGADILSGLYYLGEKSSTAKKPFLFLDLGTNGEMAVCSGSKLYLASAAAGPVFEGGGISCGCASIPGAVCHTDGHSYETIEDREPVGICGTGVLELVSALVRSGIIDRSGLLKEPFFTEGYLLCSSAAGGDIRLVQDDIRKVQLAKAAVCVGIRTLLDRLPANDRGKISIFLAGGFGSGVSIHAIRELGLFPQELDEAAVYAPGNTSLLGTMRFIGEIQEKGYSAALSSLEKIRACANEIRLEAESDFGEAYYEALNFRSEQ